MVDLDGFGKSVSVVVMTEAVLFAAGLSVGFTMGRFFERWEYEQKFRSFKKKHGGKSGHE